MPICLFRVTRYFCAQWRYFNESCEWALLKKNQGQRSKVKVKTKCTLPAEVKPSPYGRPSVCVRRRLMDQWCGVNAGLFISKSPYSLNAIILFALDAEPRTAVEGLHVTAFGPDFVSLAWLSPEGTSADLYRVRCRSEQTALDEVVYTVQPNITVRSLRPHSTYSFAVSLSSVM